jgi:carboxypeptidase Taq
MLRVELEAALMTGDIEVADIPAAWNEAMKRHLGVVVRNDREGCLQDVHWASGAMGSFCTYTIGNVMAAQLCETARSKGEGITQALENGDTFPLRLWLKENVWRHGRHFSRDELLTRATGRTLEAGPYLRYLEGKFAAA